MTVERLKALAEQHQIIDRLEQLLTLSQQCRYGYVDDVPVAMGGSKIGGHPHTDGSIEWPMLDGEPLNFVAQVRLEDLRDDAAAGSGLLLFFMMPGVWSDHKKDKDIARVIWIRNPVTTIQKPHFIQKKRLWGLLKPREMPQVFKEAAIRWSTGLSLPDLDNDDRIPALKEYSGDDDLLEAYCEIKHELHEGYVLQHGGFPSPIQYDHIAESVAKIMGRGDASNWQLLLEVESAAGFNWGDGGRLHFMIHEEDLANGEYADVWMEFQCH